MAPRDISTNTSSAIPPSSRQTSGPVAIPQDHNNSEVGDRAASRQDVTVPPEPLGFSTPPRSNISSSHHPPLSPVFTVNNTNGNNDNSNMTAPAIPGLARNKRRGGRRIIFWVCAAVIVIVVIILIEDEAELRRSDSRVQNLSWKGLPESERNNYIGEATATGSNGAVTGRKDTHDDDFFSSWFGQKAYPSSHSSSHNNNIKSTRASKLLRDKRKQKLQPFPVIQYDDDNIPKAVAGSILHASDALLCRDSVIDYVINATDLKDECDGLKKAFTKYCADEDEPALTARRRRLTKEQMIAERNSNPVVRLQQRLYYISKRWYSRWNAPDTSMFMVEDKVLEAWDDASLEVRNGWDLLYRNEDIAAILSPIDFSRNCSDEALDLAVLRALAENDVDRNDRKSPPKNPSRRDEESNDEDDDEESSDEEGPGMESEVEKAPDAQNKTIASKDTSNKHKANLALPIKNRHISDKMLSETLMLQQDQKILKAVQNQTNHTVAQADAAASKKAVSDAADMVSNILNDPTSVEARTCCTSILNVFHESCSVDDEEELSDSRLFVSVVVIAFCGLVKSLIRHFSVRWLPEAAGCILVGGETRNVKLRVCFSDFRFSLIRAFILQCRLATCLRSFLIMT